MAKIIVMFAHYENPLSFAYFRIPIPSLPMAILSGLAGQSNHMRVSLNAAGRLVGQPLLAQEFLHRADAGIGLFDLQEMRGIGNKFV